MSRRKLLHISTGLGMGGAEIMLYKLLSKTNRERFDVEVISLTDLGSVGLDIERLGIPVRSLGMKPGRLSVRLFMSLVKTIRLMKPDVIQTWMYHADLLGSIASLLAGNVPTVWNIQNSTLNAQFSKSSTVMVVRLCAFLSQWTPKLIICCAEESLRVHVAQGYAAKKMIVLPNAFELNVFRPDSNARVALRAELRLSLDQLIVGIIARDDPQKDYECFFRAAGHVHRALPSVQFVLVGKGVTRENSRLMEWAKREGVSECVHMLGMRRDTPSLHAAFDAFTLTSSYGEGFPNVIGEAMASGTPCVVTNVGDSAMIVGETGVVATIGDDAAIAEGLKTLLFENSEARTARGFAARRRIAEHFDLSECVSRYESLYLGVARESK